MTELLTSSSIIFRCNKWQVNNVTRPKPDDIVPLMLQFLPLSFHFLPVSSTKQASSLKGLLIPHTYKLTLKAMFSSMFSSLVLFCCKFKGKRVKHKIMCGQRVVENC